VSSQVTQSSPIRGTIRVREQLGGLAVDPILSTYDGCVDDSIVKEAKCTQIILEAQCQLGYEVMARPSCLPVSNDNRLGADERAGGLANSVEVHGGRLKVLLLNTRKTGVAIATKVSKCRDVNQ
jgi:hypothetical protein